MTTSFVAAAKSQSGSFAPMILESATVLPIPDDGNVFEVTGTTAIATISATLRPGRTLKFVSRDDTGAAFTNNTDTTTEGEMDLGGANRTVNKLAVLVISQHFDGSWREQSFKAN